ncbi:MAG: SPFH domain-containing protein [Betaproteobacteria bacterium]|nr:SPFH domain-containing protein [Betaproteobacteria bacterium]
MALWDFVKKQFVDVIHWTEEGEGTLAYRFPMQDMEIQYGAQLTVRETQMAVFVNEGTIADVFGPGRYKLTTQTIPVLTNLQNWDKLFESPFKSDVYFFSTRLQVDQKWGTPNAITIRDKEFGAVRLRAFGIYSYRVADPRLFHTQVSGTVERYGVDDLAGQLRSTVVGSMTNLFADSQVPFLDMAANQDQLAAQLRAKLGDGFKALGLELAGFVIENLSLPEELQKILDQRISMNMVGDMQRYTQFQVASNIGTAAANEGGLAGIGAGLASGVAMGQVMTQAIGQAIAPAQGAGPAAAPAQDVMAMIEKLHDLKTKGALSEEEFNVKKSELLAKLK